MRGAASGSDRPSQRWVKVLSAVGLVAGVVAFLMSLSSWVGPARAIAWFGLGASLVAVGVAFQAGKWPLPGLGGVVLCAFVLLRVTTFTPGAESDGASGYPADGTDVGTRGADADEGALSTKDNSVAPTTAEPEPKGSSRSMGQALTRPGPVSLTSLDLMPLTEIVVGQGVLAPWQGMWFEAEVVQIEGASVRLHFVGWETAWDSSLSVAELRRLPQGYQRRPSTHPVGSVGVGEPLACSMEVQVFSLVSLEGPLGFSQMPVLATRYALRAELSGLDAASALGGVPLRDAPAVGLHYSGTFQIPQGGTYYFAVDTNGSALFTVDGEPVSSDGKVLTSGSHSLDLRARLSTHGELQLRLRMGSAPDDLRVLDMTRYGDAQVLQEPDGGLRVSVAEAVLFRPGSAQLDPSAEAVLDRLWNRLSPTHRGSRLVIEGHTDDLGPKAANLELSQERASSVGAWYEQRGQPAERIELRAYGEARPRVPNIDAAHRAQNRRVEFVFASND